MKPPIYKCDKCEFQTNSMVLADKHDILNVGHTTKANQPLKLVRLLKTLIRKKK